MPYPGVPAEDTEKVESCVQKVMARGYEKDNAIAICVANIKGSKTGDEPVDTGSTTSTGGAINFVPGNTLYASVPELPMIYAQSQAHDGISFGQISQELYDKLNRTAGGKLPPLGDVLHFSGAVIAKVERNANGDEISLDNALELAETLPFTPLVDKHGATAKVLGVYTGGEVRAMNYDNQDGVYVVVSGLLYPRRNPREVEEITSGERKQSIEAVSEECECSVCGVKASVINDYCEHMMPILAGKALPKDVSRKHYQMRAIGGAAVKNPAGTNTGFNRDGFVVIASKEEDDNMEEQLNEITAQLEAARAELEAKVKEIETLQAKLEEAKADHDAVTASMKEDHALIMARALGLVSAGMKPDEVQEVVDELSVWSEATYNLFIAQQRKPVTHAETKAPPVVSDSKEEPVKNALDMLGEL